MWDSRRQRREAHDMPLTKKGATIKAAMDKEYGGGKKADSVFYASINSGKIKGAEKGKGKGRGKG
jgi:hypothetical protein